MRYLILPIFFIVLAFNLSAQNSYKKKIKTHRKNYKKEFLKNTAGPLDKKGVKKLAFYKANPAFVIKGKFIPSVNAVPLEMATSDGQFKQYISHGAVHFQLNGQELVLNIYRSIRQSRIPGFRDYLFLPFKDLTNGEESYGGGHYIDLRLKDIQEDHITIDFNLAYNPFCAYKESYSCPIPPFENHLQVAIYAGEKHYVNK